VHIEALKRVIKHSFFFPLIYHFTQWRTEGGGVGGFTPRNSEGPPKLCQTQPDCENLKIAEFRTPTLQDVWKKGSTILKLPPVRNCFILVMTNKLVVVINYLKVPKIKKILLYEMKFLVQNYSCLGTPLISLTHFLPFSIVSSSIRKVETFRHM